MGAKINRKHTERDYGLKMLAIEIGIPKSVSERYRVPGSNKYMNVGRKEFFETRPVKMTFDKFGSYANWIESIEKIAADVNGREVVLELDYAPGMFYHGQASVSTKKENNIVTEFEILVDVDPLKYGNEVMETVGTLESKTIKVNGDYETPCIIELIPTGDILTYLLKACARDPVTGEPEDILIKNLRQGKKVVIDGENCTVTEDGKNKFADTEMWEFPSLVPGENTLAFVSSSVPCEVTIKYKPRYI